jgi:hydroxyacid-oxoacid transhydrogenase
MHRLSRMKRYLSSSGMEYAFEMAASSVRVGRGVTKEIGHDMLALGLKDKVCVVTDAHILNLPPMRAVADALTRAGVNFEVFSEVGVEPTDASLQTAINFCRERRFEAFIAVGGGSVIDTAKAANLYMCYPDRDFLDFVNAPIGKGMPIPGKLKPLIAVPTTAGTGSETTGVSIFDHLPSGAKTGIRDRALRPILGIIDPDHTKTLPRELVAFPGLDVLAHALESYTAVPYHQRSAAPPTPMHRPAYQGCNPISDIWSGFALQQCAKYLVRAVEERDDEALEQMCLASTAAGVGFGNAGVHLCHAMSYPIASNVQNYFPRSGYQNAAISKPAMVPHGLSVIVTAPAVFQWTCAADPERHLRAAEHLGANVAQVKAKDAGLLLKDTIVSLLDRWRGFVPDGLHEMGYGSQDLERLVKGALPQRKVLDIAPRQAKPEDLQMLLEKSMKLF